MNFQSPEWYKIVEEIRQRIVQLDVTNRGSLSEIETATVRGQIKALQSLLQWQTSAALPEVEEIRFE